MKKAKVAVLVALVILLPITACCDLDSPNITSSQSKTVLSILYGQSTSDPGLEDVLTEKINKDFHDVELEWENVDWGDHFAQEMQAKIASSEMPDLIIGKNQDVEAYQPSGYLAPFGKQLTDKINDIGLKDATIGGKTYGLPYNMAYQGVLYNKNLFWRYDLKVPKNQTEMKALISRLKEVGITPFASHFQENWYAANITMQFATNQVFAEDPVWGNEFRANKRSFTDSKKYQQCFMQVQQVLQNSWSDALMVSQAESDMRFAKEQAAMYVTGTWSLQSLQAVNPSMPIGIFPYPSPDGGAKLLFEPNLTFMKSSKSQNSALVDKILMDILSDKELAQTTCAFTKTKSLLKNVNIDDINELREDIDSYTSCGRILDVTIGNSQLVWDFQDSCSSMLYKWLNGTERFSAVLQYADKNRAYSTSLY